jgi:hypothetical protein
MLFDQIKRNDYEPARYGDTIFAYWNHTARVEADRTRCEVEEWFTHYPTSGKTELRTRFRSDIDSQHQSAFFELFLHELLLRLGCQVTPHPTIPNVKKTPDFLVKSPNGERFYLEAAIVTDASAAEAASRARINAVYDVLNRAVDSPNFFLWIEIDGSPTTPPPARKLASFVNACLAELDPDEITKLYESGKTTEIPQWSFTHEGWEIKFGPMLKNPETRGKPGIRPIGVKTSGFRWVDHRTPIKNTITKKAGRYRDLDLPYVVAVNTLEFVDEIDIFEALFGKEQFNIKLPRIGSSETVETQMSRLPDGVWTGHSGPRYTRVSAVLIANQLSAWNISKSSLRLYHNPWSSKPYQSVLTRLSQAIPRNNCMEYLDGESANVILNLPASWLESTE